MSLLMAVGGHAATDVARKDTVKATAYADGHFFKSLPKDFYEKVKPVSAAFLQDSLGGKVMAWMLGEGKHLPKEYLTQAIPTENVFCRDYLLSAYHFFELGKSGKAAVRPKAGDPLPGFTAKDDKGRTWTNEDLKGKAAVLSFWYLGCAPCIKEMPELSKWVTRYPDALCLAVTYQRADQIRSVVARRGFTFHQLVEAESLWKKIGVEATPTTLIIDKNGIIRQIVTGTSEEKRKDLEKTLKELSGD